MDHKFRKNSYISYSLVAIGIIIYVYHSTLFFDWIVDDAGISFGFAKNIANGYGAVLNPGGEVVEGYSNPLWVLIISIFIRADIFDPYLTTSFLGLSLGAVNIIFTYLLTKKIVSNKKSPLNALPSVLLAFSTPFVVWNLSGLETPLYSVLLVLSTYTYVLELRGDSNYYISGFLLFLVAVTRPEGFGYFGLVAGHRIIHSYRNKFSKGDAIWFLTFLIPFGIYHAWHYSYFGFILPNTFYYKSGESLFSSLRSGYNYLLPFFTEYRMWLLILFMPIIFINSIESSLPVLDKNFSGRSVVLLMVFGGIVFVLATGGDWMMELRFLAPIIPFALVLVYIGMKELALVLCEFSQNSSVQIILLAIVFILISGLVVLPSLSASPDAASDPTVPLNNVENVEERAYSMAQRADVSGNASLLTPDMGAHAYYGELKYIDLAGLSDVTIGHHKYERGLFGEYIFHERKPTIIKTHGAWTRRSNIKSYKEFQSDYTQIDDSGNWFVRKSVFTSTTTKPRSDMDLTINNNIEFSGYTKQENITQPGGNIHYTGFWEKKQKINQSYRIKVQLEKQSTTVEQYGRQIIYGWYPTSEWKSNETYLEHYKYTIPESVDEGRYNVSIIISSSSSSFSKQIVTDDILVSDNRSSALAKEKYRAITDNKSTKQNLRLAERAHNLRPNNKTYQAVVDTYEDEYYYNQIRLARASFQRNDISNAKRHIDKVGNNLLNNRSANTIRSKISNYYVRKGDIARKQGKNSRAYQMYKTAVAVYGKNSIGIKKRTKIQGNARVKYDRLRYNSVPQNATSVKVTFGDKLDLVGYDIQSKSVKSGTVVSIEYYFECQQKMRKDYFLFSHHEGQNREVNSRNRFQGDHKIRYPTSKCSPGGIIKTYSVINTPQVDERTSVGVSMGVWYPNTGEALRPNVIGGNVSVNNSRVKVIEYSITS